MLDKTHRNLRWMSGSILVSVLSHCLMAWTTVSPYLPVITMGLSYSVLASALWSLPAIIVSQHQLGTAFGIMQVNIYLNHFVKHVSRTFSRLYRTWEPP